MLVEAEAIGDDSVGGTGASGGGSDGEERYFQKEEDMELKAVL